jgi:hypothetical protein
VASEGKPINVVHRFVIWEGGIGERHKQSTEQNTKTKNMNLTRNKTQPRWTQTQQSNWNKICDSKGYRTTEDMIFFCGFFSGSRYENRKQTKRHTSIPHGKRKIWYHLIVGWVPIFWEVRGKLIGGDLGVDDEGSQQRRFEPCSHYTTAPLVTNSCAHELASPRRLCPCKGIENTSKNRKEQSRITEEWLAHESWGLTNRISAKLFLTD